MTGLTCVVAFAAVLGGAAWRLQKRSSGTWTGLWLSLVLIALLVPNFRFTAPFDARIVALVASAAAFVTRWFSATGRILLRRELRFQVSPRSRIEYVWLWAVVALIGWICLSAIW